MRRLGLGSVVLVVAAALALGAGSAGATGARKLGGGTGDENHCRGATCSTSLPPRHSPPTGGPTTAQSREDRIVCAQPQRIVACPLAERAAATPDFCVQGEPCGVDYPVYSGEGAVVKVRRRGAATVLATLPVVE